MAFGIHAPELGEWIINLGEAAEYMFDHNIFQDNLVGVDYCEQMVRQTNPGVWDKAQRTPAPHANEHGYRTIADIMTALNPFTGEFYREALVMSRLTREMFCLMEGRHVHPSTLYPGGVGTVPSIQVTIQVGIFCLPHSYRAPSAASSFRRHITTTITSALTGITAFTSGFGTN